MCKCIENLEGQNLRFSNLAYLPFEFDPIPMFDTEWIDSAKVRKGKRPPSVLATFCPCCGERYVDESAEESCSTSE